ncbi:MAG: CoA transferase [Pyrinomonadaceae bacterium]
MGPLKGVRIVEIASIGAGPFCAMMLSDMGAEIIRVERARKALAQLQHTGEMAHAPITLTVVRGADGMSSFFEDAGDGSDYLRGAYRTVNVAQSGATIRIARRGVYGGARRRASLEMLGVVRCPHEVRADGRVISNFQFDDKAGKLLLPLPTASVEEISIVP